MSHYPGESQLPLVSMGGSPKALTESDSGAFQISASPLGLCICEILHTAFKSAVSVVRSPLTLPNICPVIFQNSTSEASSFLCRIPRPRTLCVA